VSLILFEGNQLYPNRAPASTPERGKRGTDFFSEKMTTEDVSG